MPLQLIQSIYGRKVESEDFNHHTSDNNNEASNYFRAGKNKRPGGHRNRPKLLANYKSKPITKVWQGYKYRRDKVYNYSETFFGVLPEFHINATKARESSYPWIARVVHSRTKPYPHISTAVCVNPRIFLTAARSVSSLKVPYTTIIYSGKQLQVMSIVLPTKPSKQSYDDIGVLVVKNGPITKWSALNLFETKRKDDYFNWFEDLNIENGPRVHKAVGYSHSRESAEVTTMYDKRVLMVLDVIVGIEVCVTSYSAWGKLPQAFHVPCYHPCTPKEFFNIVNRSIEFNKCQGYLGVEGAAVFNTKTNTLVGVATWGEMSFPYVNFALPVGIAIPNSKSFLEDYRCAKKIRDDKSKTVKEGYYQKLCK